jgi:hypothetical protein
VEPQRAQALAQDLTRRRAVVDLLADFDDAPQFKAKSFYRFALADASIPLNAARLCDKADDVRFCCCCCLRECICCSSTTTCV